MKLGYLVPLILAAIIFVALGVGLTLDPREIPSVLIDKPAPEFSLPSVYEDQPAFSKADLTQGRVSVVNVFASWCVSCRAEHKVLVALKDMNLVPIYGLDYKDKREDALAFLEELGDPFTKIGMDLKGRVGIEWGVYGVPETFIVDGEGRIRHKHIGPMTLKTLDTKIVPMIRELSGQ